MRLTDCYNTADFRELARRRLPGPIFHYIDGGSDDELTLRRNSEAFERCDLVPDVLVGADTVDPGVTVLGKRVGLPFFLSPTALQRLFHHDGERAVARAAERFNTWFGISSLGTVSLEEIGRTISTPKLFQFYVHKDQGLNRSMIQRARDAGFDALAITVDTAVGGNRERDLHTGFTTPMRLTPRSVYEFARHPAWAWHHYTSERFELSNLKDHVAEGSKVSITVSDYFSNMLDPTLNWAKAESIAAEWGGVFVIKGLMSVSDARRAADMGAHAIMLSNHGGRQLDGSRAPFDQLPEIVDAVGGRIEVICDGGVRRGTHVLKALSAGATACSSGRAYLYALAAAGQAGVERALAMMQAEIERGMKLMGVRSLDGLSRDKLRYR